MKNGQIEQPIYEGLLNKHQPPIEGFKDPTDGREYFPYIPDSKLVKALNLAIKLNRPLLLEGEPGCGKTRLADAIAYEFTHKYLLEGDKEVDKILWKYYIWNVKSVGQARDGLYSFDAVARLRDAQLVGADPQRLQEILGDDYEKLKDRLADKRKYVKLGKLGQALEQQNVKRPIVLIDEIDKADSDFPNDLLIELDRLCFEIPETDEIYPKQDEDNIKPKPIVIITSNQERSLPEPFLRRCLYYYLSFPNESQLTAIVESRFGTKTKQKQKLIEATIQHLQDIRNFLNSQPGSKKPGTSELLDFLEVLTSEKVSEGIKQLKELAENHHLLGIILKTQVDQELYREAIQSGKLQIS